MTDIPAWVADYIGIPFVAHGRDRTGWDCWGCVRACLAEQFSVTLPSYANDYASTSDRDQLSRLIAGEMAPWRPVVADDECAGDVVLLRVRGRPIHVGLVVVPKVMLHVEEGIATCLERYDGPRWAKRVIGVFRYQESGIRDQGSGIGDRGTEGRSWDVTDASDS